MIKRKVRYGYSTTTVYYDRVLKDHSSAQCGVIIHTDSIDFMSYSTRVITIRNDGMVECTGTYSPTTRKQIGWFLKEYAPNLSYYDMKEIANTGRMMNRFTKEIK